jgi:hypothetical protein
MFSAVKWEEGFREACATSLWASNRKRVVHEAMGVVGAITPWNVPLYVNVGKVVSALLAGCTVILKPAPDTPGMGAIIGELAREAGYAAGRAQRDHRRRSGAGRRDADQGSARRSDRSPAPPASANGSWKTAPRR